MRFKKTEEQLLKEHFKNVANNSAKEFKKKKSKLRTFLADKMKLFKTTKTYRDKEGEHNMVSEQLIINVASNALFDMFKEAWGLRKKIQITYRIKDNDLISYRLSLNNAIPGKLKDEILSLRYKIQSIITSIATEIEKEGYNSIEEALKSRNLMGDVRDRADKLSKGQFDLQVSYNSMSIALKFLCEANKELLAKLEDAENKNQNTELLLMNSVLVIEIIDSIIAFLKTFKLRGLSEIESVCNEVMMDLDVNEKQDERFKEDLLNNQDSDVNLKNRSLKDIEIRKDFRKNLKIKWQNFLKSARKSEDYVELFRAKIKDLTILRVNAENQLAFLQIVAITCAMENNIKAVQGLLNIEDIELKKLTPTLLYELLGVDYIETV